MKDQTLSVAGASDIRELAKAFARIGMTKADLVAVLKKRYGHISKAERGWLDRVWLAAR